MRPRDLPAKTVKNRRCRMILRIADDGDFAAVFGDDTALWDRFRSVIGPLCMDVRPQRAKNWFDRQAFEDRDKIDIRKRRDDLSAF